MIKISKSNYGSVNYVNREGRCCVVYSLDESTILKLFNLPNYCLDITVETKNSAESEEVGSKIYSVMKNLVKHRNLIPIPKIKELKNNYSINDINIIYRRDEKTGVFFSATYEDDTMKISLRPNPYYNYDKIITANPLLVINSIVFCFIRIIEGV